MKSALPLLALFATILFGAGTLSAQTVTGYSRQPSPDYRPSNDRPGNYPMNYFGPRIEWARPGAAGPLNVLMFTHTAAAREAVELTSRIDSQVDLILSSGNGGFDTWADNRRGDQGGFYAAVPSKQALDDRTAALLSPAYKHDVILIGRLMWTIIPENFRQQILAKVKAGTALVFVSPWEVEKPLLEAMRVTAKTPLAGTIRQTVPLAMLPLDVTLEPRPGTRDKVKTMGPFEVSAGRLGEGRVVFIQYNDFRHYKVLKAGEVTAGVSAGPAAPRPLRLEGGGENSLTPLPDFVGNDPLFYDYYFSLLGKALLHAAGREPAVRIEPEAVAVELPRQKLPATPVAFKLAGAVRPGMAVHYEIRDRANRVIDRGSREAGGDAAASRLEPEFPVVPPGLYVVDAWLKRGSLTTDWASAAVTVTGPKYLEAVVADKDSFGRTEGICGRLDLATTPPAGHTVVVTLWDTHKRLEQRLELAAGETTFRFAPIQHPLSRAYRIEARVRDGDAVVDRQECWTGLPSSDIEDFQFVVWDAALGGRAAQVRMQLFKDHGLTGYFDMAQYLGRDDLMKSADLLVQNNLTAWPLCYGLWSWSPKRYGDLTNGPWKEQFRKVYTDRTNAYKRYGTLAYGIDSESDFDVDETWDVPAGREDYRTYLQGRYRDLAGLNKVWGTSFASFDEIGFVSLMEAKTARQPTRWLEQQRYKRDRFNDAAEYSATLVREFVPGARVSHDIAVVPAKPSWDMPRMTGVIDAFIQSDLEHFDKRNRQRLGSGYWFGYYQNELGEWQMRTKPWESLFQGGKAIAWWPGELAFTTDLSAPLICLEQGSEEIREIRAGAGQLLMAADKRVDPILILWSWESWMAAIYNPLETDWSNAVNGFINLFRRLGLEYQCVGEDFLRDKLRFGPEQRVLVLPASQCLSNAAAEKVREFAAAGGIVMADYLPATMDEYLRPYGASSAKPAGEVTFETCPTCKGKKIIHLGGAGDPLGNCPVCGGTGSVAKGGNLALDKSILDDVFDFTKKGIRPKGKGFGVFFKGAPSRDEWRALRTMLVKKGGVRGDLEVLDILGNTRTDLRTYVYDSGPAVYVGVLPDKTVPDPPGEEFILKTAKPVHAYNVRTHAYLGHSAAVSAGILSTQPKLFALLPDRIEGLAVTADKTTSHPGEVVSLDIKSLPESLADVALAVRVEVLQKGKAIEPLTKNIVVKKATRHAVPLALNQKPGRYTVRLTEVISGQREEVVIDVKAKP